jgi:hypothetical protein
MLEDFNLLYQIIAIYAMELHRGQGTRCLSDPTKVQSPTKRRN